MIFPIHPADSLSCSICDLSFAEYIASLGRAE